MKQRDAVVMTDDEVAAFLHERRTATLATHGPDGAVHLVGMWYAVLDGEIWLESKAKAQKVVNLRRDPRASLLVEAGLTYDQLRGVAFEGRAEIVDDADRLWRVAVDMFERYTGPYTEEMRPLVELTVVKRVAIRMVPERVRSWDHRKLGLGPIPLGGTTAAFLERPGQHD